MKAHTYYVFMCSTSYRAIKPEGIRAGYLVEVQGGFCAVPIGKELYKFLLKLRSICVLDREVDSVRASFTVFFIVSVCA